MMLSASQNIFFLTYAWRETLPKVMFDNFFYKSKFYTLHAKNVLIVIKVNGHTSR
jgi:hypothetical protein